jgi:hypothetical protein
MVLYRFEAKSFWIRGGVLCGRHPGPLRPEGAERPKPFSIQKVFDCKWYNLEFGQFGLLELFLEGGRASSKEKGRAEGRILLFWACGIC